MLLRVALLLASPYVGVCKPRGAIIYLAQVRHASYGLDSLAYLERSLRHLFHYYNEQQRDDVIILHEGDFEAATQARVLTPYAGHAIRFHLLTSKYWAMPVKLRNTNRSTWEGYPHYSEGYRTMIRFFSVSLWNLMDDLGYEYVMRMDEESLLRSPIRYNLFERMQLEDIEYGYRQTAVETGFGGAHAGVHGFLKGYLLREEITPEWLFASCNPSVRHTAARAAALGGGDGWSLTQSALRNFTIVHCGEFVGFYNNFFITKVRFWRSERVQRFLQHVDRSGFIYTRRWNDIIWQTSTVRIFMPMQRVRLLDDFSYEHFTKKKVRRVVGGRADAALSEVLCPACGAVSIGTSTEASGRGCERGFVEELMRDAFPPVCFERSSVFFGSYSTKPGRFGWSLLGPGCGVAVHAPGAIKSMQHFQLHRTRAGLSRVSQPCVPFDGEKVYTTMHDVRFATRKRMYRTFVLDHS